MLKNMRLDELVNNGTLKDYTYEYLDEAGNVVKKEKGMRNSQRLILTFPNDEFIVLNTICSGALENTYICIT